MSQEVTLAVTPLYRGTHRASSRHSDSSQDRDLVLHESYQVLMAQNSYKFMNCDIVI